MNNTQYINSEKKKMVEEISKMHNIEQIEIFKVFLKHDIKFTRNNNGIFINLSKVDDVVLDKIKERINFYNKNNKYLEEDIRRREILKK